MKSPHLPTALLATASLALAGSTPSAFAAVTVFGVVDQAPDGGAAHQAYTPTAFSASGVDLLEGKTATTTGTDNQYEFAVGVSTWSDGSLDTVYPLGGPDGDDVDHAGYGSVGIGDTITYDLDGVYNLSLVDVFAGWNDSGRDNISFELLTSTNGTDFDLIASYTKEADDTGVYTAPRTNFYSVSDDAGDLATGVQYLRLNIVDADNGVAGIAEIDAFGTLVPEPASLGLLALGGLACIRRRR